MNSFISFLIYEGIPYLRNFYIFLFTVLSVACDTSISFAISKGYSG